MATSSQTYPVLAIVCYEHEATGTTIVCSTQDEVDRITDAALEAGYTIELRTATSFDNGFELLANRRRQPDGSASYEEGAQD